MPVNPWRQENLVHIQVLSRAEVDEMGWSCEGPVEILDPSNHNEALQGVDWAEI